MEVIQKLMTFPPGMAGDLLQKTDSVSGLKTPEFIAELTRNFAPRLREFTSAQFTSTISLLASWANELREKRKRSRLTIDPTKVFFEAASNEMASRLMEFAPHEINCCLAAFVSTGFAEH